MSSPKLKDFNCIFCNECFDNKEELQTHFRKHGDPKFNQNVKSNKTRSQNEPQVSGDKLNEDSEVVSCDVCTDVFPTISKAITHKHKVHPDHDAKYFCPWCGKLFTMKHLYNKHIESSHDSKADTKDTGFHCDYCEVDFFVPSAMVYHNKFFHRQDTELAVIGQSKKLKLFKQEPLQLYYCPFCGEEYFNKVNLHKHMGDDHIDENQTPEDVLRCSLCDAIFYHLDAYELHLTFHSAEDLYSEENEIIKDIIEYSLEAVPPLLEKVENLELEDYAEATMNSMGIETFLQQAMDDSLENDNSNNEFVLGKKSKKRKKHKKSKKSAITLDEFLNMNKDVFGEGIDFAGIEEVPSRVVTKQLKAKSKKSNTMPSTKLTKLRMQGITIKTPSGKTLSNIKSKKNVKPVTKTINKSQNPINELNTLQNTNTTNKTSEVISKLIAQSNSELKIVKKCTQDNIASTEKDLQPYAKEDSGKKPLMNKSNETECTNSQKGVDNTIKPCEQNKATNKIKSIEEAHRNNENDEVESSKIFRDKDIDADSRVIDELRSDVLFTHKKNVPNFNDDAKKSLNVLRSLNQSITIKPVASPKGTVTVQNEVLEEKETDDGNNTVKGRNDKNIDDTQINENAGLNKNSLNAIKHLSHLITVKSVNKVPSTTPITLNRKIDSKNKLLSPNDESKFDSEYEEEPSKLPKDEGGTQRIDEEHKEETPKSLGSLKNLSKHITIKSMPQTFNTSKSISNAAEKISDKKNKAESMSENISETLSENPESRSRFSNQYPQIINKSPLRKDLNKCNENVVENAKIRQPGIPDLTTKAAAQSINHMTFKSSPPITNIVKSDIKNNTQREPVKEEYEIFNVDDSDDEESKMTVEKINKEVKTIDKAKDVKSIDVLKNLSKNIIVKSTIQQNMPIKKEMQYSEVIKNQESHSFDSFESEDEVHNGQITRTIEQSNDSQNILKSLSKHITVKAPAQPTSINKSKPVNTKQSLKEETFKHNICNKSDEESYNTEMTPGLCKTTNTKSLEVLKSLSKHITIKSNAQQISPISKIKQIPEETIQKEHQTMLDDENYHITEKVRPENKPINITKNLSKNITFKSTPTQNFNKGSQKIITREVLSRDNRNCNPNKIIDNIIPSETITKQGHMSISEKSKTLQNKLSTLSKHITIKSTNSSPTIKKFTSSPFKSNMQVDEYNSDSDSSIGNVQIKEITENDDLDEEELDQTGGTATNVVIQSPDGSYNENEHFDEDDFDPDNFESKIKPNTIRKPTYNSNADVDNLKHLNNIGKNVVIKKGNKLLENIESRQDEYDKLNEELTVKYNRPMNVLNRDGSMLGNKNTKQVSEHSQCVNKNISTSNSIINKAVTVKTVQTKTVVQEVTTTVTKTIRTLNQTVKQEVRNTNSNISTPIRPQKNPVLQQSAQLKNYQGMAVRQASSTIRQGSPTIGTKIGNTAQSVRPSLPIRPSNQLVPIRPPRPSHPRMPQINKSLPSPSKQQPVIGQPLKISPNAMIQPTKRSTVSTPDDSCGPFSCFKKPKESLIPFNDVPDFTNNQDEMHFSSSSQISRSNFSTSTKIVKGDSVVTSTRTKSDVNVCSEQLARLGNMSGLKITKSSQSKEASQIDKTENSSSNRTTLAAIEKLQKQGLLVKKPRLNDIQYSEHTDSEGDDEFET